MFRRIFVEDIFGVYSGNNILKMGLYHEKNY